MISSSKKKILFVLPFLPYPLESGGHQALFSGIRAVNDDNNVFLTYEAFDSVQHRNNVDGFVAALPNVTLLPYLHPEPVQSKRNLYWKLKNAFWTKLNSIVRKEPKNSRLVETWLNSVKPLSAGYITHLDHIFQEYDFDIIQVEMPWMIAAVLNLPVNAKKVFVHHEIGFVRHELEMSGRTADPELKSYYGYVKMIEVSLLNRYDLIITLSDIDKEKLIKAGVVKPVESSFAVVDSCMSPVSAPYSKTLSFIGLGIHEPNYLGLLWFLDNCWPQIQKKDNRYHLIIIGKWDDSISSELSSKHKNIEFKGYVDDLNSALQGTLMIVPILIGSGIRMKILEAASRGIPFVSTSVGAEGLPVTDGYDCFICDTPEKFIEAIFKMEDDSIRNSFVANARNMVIAHYSLEALKNNRIGILSRIDS